MAPASVAPATAAHTTPTVTGEWQVLLGRKFVAYEDNRVQRALETGWQQGVDEVEVTVRGADYVVRLGREMVQQVKGDPSRWRAVRRVAN